MQKLNNTQLYRFLFASSIGTFLEFFDLALYSFCSALIAKHFFPTSTTMFGIILTWTIFAISYLMRPLGAILFGHMADTHGGKKAMIYSMAIMAMSTSAIGILPSYSVIGLAAPIILLILRILQSIAVSPEYNLASVFIKNNDWCKRHYGLISSISASVTGLGMLSASLLMSMIFANTDLDLIPDYQWRLPFVVAGLLVGTLGIYFRMGIDDSKLGNQLHVMPLKLVLEKQPKDFIRAIIISGYIGCITYALFSFLVHQLQNVRDMTPGESLMILGHGAFIPALFSLIAGFFSDYVPRYLLMLAAALVIVISGYLLFSQLHILSDMAIMIESYIMLAGLGFFAGSFPGYLAELFSREYRYTGSFLAYNVGMSWIGGVSPILFISLANVNQNLPIFFIISYSLVVIVLLIHSMLPFAGKQIEVYHSVSNDLLL